MGGQANRERRSKRQRPLPLEFAKRVDVRYGAPVAKVTQDDRGVK